MTSLLLISVLGAIGATGWLLASYSVMYSTACGEGDHFQVVESQLTYAV